MAFWGWWTNDNKDISSCSFDLLHSSNFYSLHSFQINRILANVTKEDDN